MTDPNVPKIRVVIVHEAGGLDVAEIPDDLDVFREIIDCDCVDMPRRYIGDLEYRIVCDDAGLIKNRKATCSHIWMDNAMLVGTVIFTKFSETGINCVPLTDYEIHAIMDHYNEETCIVEDLSFRPSKFFGIDLWKWDKAYHQDRHAADNVHFLCMAEEITQEDAEAALDRIRLGDD